MNFLALAAALCSFAALVAACRLKGYTEGQKQGYEKGFQEGHKAADDWWLNWEREVCKTREVIRSNGDEEGWP